MCSSSKWLFSFCKFAGNDPILVVDHEPHDSWDPLVAVKVTLGRKDKPTLRQMTLQLTVSPPCRLRWPLVERVREVYRLNRGWLRKRCLENNLQRIGDVFIRAVLILQCLQVRFRQSSPVMEALLKGILLRFVEFGQRDLSFGCCAVFRRVFHRKVLVCNSDRPFESVLRRLRDRPHQLLVQRSHSL